MSKGLWKTTLREIKSSLGRYLAILAIVALGVGFFVGLKMTRPVMMETVTDFIRDRHFYDYRLLSTLGFTEEDEAAFAAIPDAESVQGAYTIDVLYENGQNDSAIRVHTITPGINDCYVKAGRMPEQANECVVDSHMMTEADIGSELRLSRANEADTLDSFRYAGYTVVGIVQNPYYLNFERGNTSLGDGTLAGYVFIPKDGFNMEYYTEILVKLAGEYPLYSDEYKDYMKRREDAVDDLVKDRVDIRYASIMDEANEKLADGEKELADAKDALADGEKEIADAKDELRDGERKLADAKKKLADGTKTLADAKKALKDGEKELESSEAKAEKSFAKAKKQLDDSEKEIEKNEKTLTKGGKQLEEAKAELAKQEKALQKNKKELTEQKKTVEAALQEIYGARELYGVPDLYADKEQELLAALGQIEEGLKQIAAGEGELEKGKKELAKQEKQLKKAQAELTAGKKKLEKGREDYKKEYAAFEKQMKTAKKELADARKSIADGEREQKKGAKKIKDSEADIKDGWKEVEDGEAELLNGKKKIEDAELEIADAKKEIDDIPEPQHYVLERDTNIGYVCFESDSKIVDNIADVFPLFFFMVALLICITTMNRMVDEHRTQIGVLKALGYSRGAIMTEYVVYAGSSAIIGAVIGFLIGNSLFPYVIWNAYGIMYEVCGIHFVFDWRIILLSIFVALLCSVGATVFSCYVEFISVPATLMRPKPPKNGKRILLEHIHVIWNRLSFLQKVSVRNVLRYKKRFLMMVLGISGCTALLVTGFGIRDSIKGFADVQYTEIQTYDIEAVLSDGADADKRETLSEELADVADDMLFVCGENVDIIGAQSVRSVTLSVPETVEKTPEYLHLYEDGNGDLAFPEFGEGIITDKIAERLGISVGDTITLRREDMREMTLTVRAITKNYVYNYLYMSPETYEAGFKEAPEYKKCLIKVPANLDLHEAAAVCSDRDDVLQLTVTEDTRLRITNMMTSLNAVVLLVIICAGSLAFIVLYNLTNINITERIREIATIKVLGFYPMESAQYVFRENMVLTLLGAAVGLVLGKCLHLFVMHNIDIDMISFSIHVEPLSYALAFVMTVIFSLFVDFAMYFKLEKINMAESLKSIE